MRRVRAKSTMAKQHEVLLSISDQQEYAIRKLFCENNWESTYVIFSHNRIIIDHLQQTV